MIALVGSRGCSVYWQCRCDCGNIKELPGSCLGHTQSCGCLSREQKLVRSRIHGEAGRQGVRSPEYWVWLRMIARCENENNPKYPDYGGRGIHICAEWRHDVAAFIRDVGRRPSTKHSIDRFPNNDGNYEPGNVRWATANEQAANRRSTNRLITVDGEVICVAEMARRLAMQPKTLYAYFNAKGAS